MHRNNHHVRLKPRRRIGMSRGVLRQITLDILRREPSSGSELVDEIEYYTDWKPSCGSIYPLLSKLEKQGLIKSVESEDPSLKRYALTKGGVKAIEEHKKSRPPFESHYYSIQKIFWKLFKGMNEELFEAQSAFLDAIEKILPFVNDKPEESLKLQKQLLETAARIKRITEDLEQKK